MARGLSRAKSRVGVIDTGSWYLLLIVIDMTVKPFS
jgi:hypothetical protein